jgi:DNA-binding CsgD family transcriptional regulator
MERHPLIRHYVDSTDRRPLAVTDVTSLRRWRDSAVGSDIHAVTGFYDHLAIPLRSRPGTMRAFALGREDGGFTAEEREFVERLHPSLIVLDDRARAPRPGATALTRREEQVLDLIGRGLARQAVARRLEISARTVDKHLESVYRKLGVNSHVQAILAVAESRRASRPNAPESSG